jgi:hypothetical protein
VLQLKLVRQRITDPVDRLQGHLYPLFIMFLFRNEYNGLGSIAHPLIVFGLWVSAF